MIVSIQPEYQIYLRRATWMQKDLSIAFRRKYRATIVNLNTNSLLTQKLYLRRRPEYGPNGPDLA